MTLNNKNRSKDGPKNYYVHDRKEEKKEEEEEIKQKIIEQYITDCGHRCSMQSCCYKSFQVQSCCFSLEVQNCEHYIDSILEGWSNLDHWLCGSICFCGIFNNSTSQSASSKYHSTELHTVLDISIICTGIQF